MATDNRTLLNDCDANTGWAGDDTANPISTAGSFIEGAGALSTQLSNADEHMYTTEDSGVGGTFSINMADMTLYMNIKDNLGDSFANGGIQYVIGDGTNRVGYDVAGNDAPGMPHELFFAAYKLDVSVRVATPGTNFTNFAGTEGSLTQTAITQIGYGSLHLAKAVGSVDNVIMDGFYYIANDSYALTIDGGTVGTPETMADVLADNNTNGWGLVNNPFGNAYGFFGPTEFGTPSGTADSYFEAVNEQWFWIGDNQGGEAVGATHFPFRLVGNGTGTNSFVLTNSVIVNTGRASEFDCSDSNMDIVTIEGCTFDGLASFQAPAAGTSDSCTSNTFVNCGQVTGNEADFSGSSFITSTVAADGAAMNWNETISASHNITELDDTTFEMGTNNHHAISFPTTVSDGADITLSGIAFNGFDTTGSVGASEDTDNSMLEFLATTGTITVNLVGCTVDGGAATESNFTVDARAGCTVTLVIDPKQVQINVKDNTGTNVQNARVFLETAATASGGEAFEASVTSITQAAGTATVTTPAAHGLEVGDKFVIRGAQPDGYNKHGTVLAGGHSSTTFTYTVDSGLSSPATGTPLLSYVAIQGLTDASGNISVSRTWGADQDFKGWARKNSAAPFLKQSAILFTVDSANGNTVNVALQPDE